MASGTRTISKTAIAITPIRRSSQRTPRNLACLGRSLNLPAQPWSGIGGHQAVRWLDTRRDHDTGRHGTGPAHSVPLGRDGVQLATAYLTAGGRVPSEPFDVFDAGRMGVFADPEGAVFCVWQPGSHRGSAAVNEHGAVNFNNLHTGDVEAARAFYGAVFGWTTIDAGSPMWALPGYGDHLEELNPGMRAGMKQMGAPEGFENVVATVLPREGGPARWSVTFAVDDADAIAARARELGGSVLAEPQNAPWVRFAVLADPAGAPFTASQFVAENR